MAILFAESFANYFSKYGEIIDSVIMIDKHSGRPRGFGFVTFADPAVADTVLEEDHVLDGRAVTFLIKYLIVTLPSFAKFQLWISVPLSD